MFFITILACLVFFLLASVPERLISGIPMESIIGAYVMSNALDCHSTIRFLKITGDIENEGNPLVRLFLRWFGFVWGAVIFKIIVAPLVFWAIFPSQRSILGLSVVIFLVALGNYCSVQSPALPESQK